MSLSDALRQGPQAPARATFYERLEQSLPAEEFVALTALLNDARWSADAISNLLAEAHNESVSATTIRAWRRKHCAKA